MGQQDIIELVNKNELSTVHAVFTDIAGNQKTVFLEDKNVVDLLNDSIWVDSSDVTGLLHICDDELLLKPDLSTFNFIGNRVYTKSATVNCKVYKRNGSFHEINPTEELNELMSLVKSLGMDINGNINSLFRNNNNIQVINKNLKN